MFSNLVRCSIRGCLLGVFLALLVSGSTGWAMPSGTGVRGSVTMHDPSTIIKCKGRYYIYGTGPGIRSKSSADGVFWTDGPAVFARPRPVSFPTVVLAQLGSAKLEDRFRTTLQPEFFAPLDATVDLLDRRFHRRAADRQAQATIFRVVHSLAVVGHVGQRFFHGLSSRRGGRPLGL